jgi:hypothetical protein
VGLEYKLVIMLPSLTMVVVSRKDILVCDTSRVNFIDEWILLACSKNSSSSLSLCIHLMSISSINRNHERGCLSDERSYRSSMSPIKMFGIGGCHFGSHSCPIYLKIVVSVKSKIVAF